MSGKMGAGKDTLGDEIEGFLSRHDYQVVSMSYALPIKKEMQEVIDYYEKEQDYIATAERFNVTSDNIKTYIEILDGKSIYERTDEARRAIQYWGTDIRRKQDTDYWVKQLAKMIVKELIKGNSVKVSDVRFKNEANSILDLNGKIVRIELSDETRIKRIIARDNLTPTEKHLNHVSEKELDDYNFEQVLDGENTIKMLTHKALNYVLGENNK